MIISKDDELRALNGVLGEVRGIRDALETIHDDTDADRKSLKYRNAISALLYLMEDKIGEAECKLYALEHGTVCTSDHRYGMIPAGSSRDRSPRAN